MNKQQLQQEIAELQKQLEEKQKTLSAMPDKWEPKGGEWFIDLFGEASTTSMMARELSSFGVSYATREQAEKAAKAMRAHNRLLAYVAEFAPDYNPDWSDDTEEKAYVSKSQRPQGRWSCFVQVKYKAEGTIYMPVSVADELCDKLNSGEVEL